MQAPEFEITQLWTSTLLVQPLPDHAPHTRRLAAIADADPDLAILSADDPAVDWLKANVAHGIGAMLQRAGFSGPPQIQVNGRLDVQSFGDLRSLRDRPGAYLAGLYVVTAPASDPELGTRDDRRHGCISFYDPRVGMNMNAIRKDPYVHYHHTIPFEPGLLLLWPAFVPYFVHPNLAHQPAIRISMDVALSRAPRDGDDRP